MSYLVLIGRILFVALFVGSTFGHFTQTKAMTGYAQSKGVPQPWLATVVGGVMLGVGSLSVLLGIWPDLGALVLAAFLLPTAVMMHGFWKETGDARQMEQIQFLKDLSLAGACLALAGLFAMVGDELGLTITGPLFG